MQNGKDGTQMKATGIVRRIDELGRVVIPTGQTVSGRPDVRISIEVSSICLALPE